MSSVLDAASYYRATAAPWPGTAPLRGEAAADVCVIGAGLTGLSAALELAAAGRRVVVLDKGPVGWGASGRNGGHICTGFSPGMAKFEKALGVEAARACFAVAEDAKRLIVERSARYGIDCDLVWGYLVVAARASHMAELAEHGAEYDRYGYHDWSLLDREALTAKLASPIYHGALRDTGSGHMHVLNYVLGLARAVQAEGGVIHERSPVVRIDDGAPATVHTAEGRVRADQVVLGCNAYLDGLVAEIAPRVMPVASYVVATEPLGEAGARALIRDNEAVGDSNFVIDYFRLTADHRLLFGGRCSYSGIDPADLAANMRPRLTRVFPQLAKIGIDYAWGGYIGITHSRLPDAGRVGRALYYAQGYSGQGVALAGMFGKLMAEAIMGEAERFDIFGRIRHAPFPGGILRRPALTLGMLYYRMKDLLA